MGDGVIPADKKRVLDLYFLEHRAKVLDVAAFLDRYDRAAGDDHDPRMLALRKTIEVLQGDTPDRAKRVLELLSDVTAEPIESAPAKGATGAPEPGTAEWD
ncbi:MAG: hypothetical protein AAGI17_07115 [Planctomycetota bacterium]